MSKKKRYICESCGNVTPKWQGKCESCSSWNTISEYLPESENLEHLKTLSSSKEILNAKALNLSELEVQNVDRIQTNINEFNHVCGGGLVPGAVMLIGGEPGIGKSTLLLQLCNSFSENINGNRNALGNSVDNNSSGKQHNNRDAGNGMREDSNASGENSNSRNGNKDLDNSFVQGNELRGDNASGKTNNALNNMKGKPLYISGEEAAGQVALRAQRLGIDISAFNCAFGTNMESIYLLLEQEKPGLVIIDSIQTMHYSASDSSAGTITQIRICTQLLTEWAKSRNVPMIMVGHITKEGGLAGPKLLEHMVDVVLYFEGERAYPFRMLRGVKNRFGATDEIGIFEMAESGLQEVENPSKLFLSENENPSAGSVVFPSIEGSRPLLMEIQSLTMQSFMQMPRRAVTGWDQSRLSMIAAVLETKLKLPLSKKEIYINVAAGMKINEPASDLAVAFAIFSSILNKPITKGVVVFGEISLSGEIRYVTRTESRLKEAAKLGFNVALIPYSSNVIKSDIKAVQFKNIVEAWNWIKDS